MLLFDFMTTSSIHSGSAGLSCKVSVWKNKCLISFSYFFYFPAPILSHHLVYLFTGTFTIVIAHSRLPSSLMFAPSRYKGNQDQYVNQLIGNQYRIGSDLSHLLQKPITDPKSLFFCISRASYITDRNPVPGLNVRQLCGLPQFVTFDLTTLPLTAPLRSEKMSPLFHPTWLDCSWRRGALEPRPSAASRCRLFTSNYGAFSTEKPLWGGVPRPFSEQHSGI